MSKLSFIEADGKLEGAPTTLEQIWGANEISKYGTTSEEEYKNTLLEFNRSDLVTHARQHGVMVAETSEQTINRLLTEFNKYNLSFRIPIQKSEKPGIPSKEVQRILAEGR